METRASAPDSRFRHSGPLAVRAERQWRPNKAISNTIVIRRGTARGPRRKAMETVRRWSRTSRSQCYRTARGPRRKAMETQIRPRPPQRRPTWDRSRSAPKGNGDLLECWCSWCSWFFGPLAVRAERQWRQQRWRWCWLSWCWTARGPRRKAMETARVEDNGLPSRSCGPLAVRAERQWRLLSPRHECRGVVVDRSRSAPKGNGDATAGMAVFVVTVPDRSRSAPKGNGDLARRSGDGTVTLDRSRSAPKGNGDLQLSHTRQQARS